MSRRVRGQRLGLMQIRRRVDYGLRAIIYLSLQEPEKYCSINEMATLYEVRREFLEEIIQNLIRCGLIKSKRGACRGYTLARPLEQISFYDVIEAIEGVTAHRNERRGAASWSMPARYNSVGMYIFSRRCKKTRRDRRLHN